jgi:hypothetical protein
MKKWINPQTMLLQSFETTTLQRISQHNITFPQNTEVASSLNNTSSELRDFGTPELPALEDLSTQHNTSPELQIC